MAHDTSGLVQGGYSKQVQALHSDGPQRLVPPTIKETLCLARPLITEARM